MNLTVHGRSLWKWTERERDVVLQSGMSQAGPLSCFDSPAPVPGPITGRNLAAREYPAWMRSWSWRSTSQRWACWRSTILLGSTQLTLSHCDHVSWALVDCVSCFTILLSLYHKGLLAIWEARCVLGPAKHKTGCAPVAAPTLCPRHLPSPPGLDRSALGKESRQHFLPFSHTLMMLWPILYAGKSYYVWFHFSAEV